MSKKIVNENECFLIAKDMLTRFGTPAPFFTGFYFSNQEDVSVWRNPSNYIYKSARALNIISDSEDISFTSFKQILEIYWSFITNGILIPNIKISQTSSNHEDKHKVFENLRLTEYGEKFTQERLPSPYQINEFVEEIKINSIPVFNEVIEIYLLQSLNCFNFKLNLASMFLLGDAVEQIFYKLLQHFSEKCLELSIQNKFQSKFETYRIDKAISEFKKLIQKNKGKLKRYSKRHYNDWLSAFDEIRVDRNAIGHANTEYFDKNVIYGYYLRLRHVLRELKPLIKDFENDEITSLG